MSWDVMRKDEIECLCGKGKIEQEILSDDWGRVDETAPVIKCEECSKKYKIESKYYNPKPYHGYTIYYCIDKETNEKIKIDL